jgi:3-oxoacyl-[acyl-carrier protein] reductase
VADLDGRVALVTGASRGIGRAVALRLAGAGAHVGIGFLRDRQGADAVAASVRDVGRRAAVCQADMAVPAEVGALVTDVESALGPVDVLVANAGIGPRGSLDDIDVETWDRVLAVNLRGPFLLAQAVAPGMRGRGWGRIVLMSSVAAFTGGILGPHYTASKAGLIGLARSLARALAPDGVTVNAVAPALIETDMIDEGAPDPDALADSIPVGRLGRPEEVAELVLAVVANGYVTGQTFSVDGGLHPR